MSVMQQCLDEELASPLFSPNPLEVSFCTPAEQEHEAAVHSESVALESRLQLERVLNELETQGGVSKTQAMGLEAFGVRIPNINGYTAQPSRTNYQVTVEGIIGKLGETVRKIWEVICNFFRRLFSFGKKSEALKDVAKEATKTREKEVKEQKKAQEEVKKAQTEVKAHAAKTPSALGDLDFMLKNTTADDIVFDKSVWSTRELAIRNRMANETRARQKELLQLALSDLEAINRNLAKGEDKDSIVQEAIRALADLRPLREFQKLAQQLARGNPANEIALLVRSRNEAQWERLLGQLDRKLEPVLGWVNKALGEKRDHLCEFTTQDMINAAMSLTAKKTPHIQPRNMRAYVESVFKEVPGDVEDAGKAIDELSHTSGDPIRDIEKLMKDSTTKATAVRTELVSQLLRTLRAVQTLCSALGSASTQQLRFARVLAAYENRLARLNHTFNMRLTGLGTDPDDKQFDDQGRFETFMTTEDPLKL